DQSVAEAYRAPRGAGSVFHALSSDVQLVWSGTQLVFPAENDGWLHFYSVPASGGEARLLTPGRFEIEYAAASADGSSIVYSGKAPVDLMAEGLPADFPAAALVVPESIELPKRAGIASHAELFVPPSVTPGERHPAVVFMHGGPIRQMLAGWHYMDYYSNAYAF